MAQEKGVGVVQTWEQRREKKEDWGGGEKWVAKGKSEC